MVTDYNLTIPLIEQVKKRPDLYNGKRLDNSEKLKLWRDIGREVFTDWNNLSKSEKYDRVLQLQKRWRSIRDAYKTEIRGRLTGKKRANKTYIHFRKLLFLGGLDGVQLDDVEDDGENASEEEDSNEYFEHSSDGEPSARADPLHTERKRKRNSDQEDATYLEPSIEPTPQLQVEDDSDKQFLLSFLPELKKLPAHLRMWARAQIANIMQQAVTDHYNSGSSSKRKQSGDITFKCDNEEYE